MSDCRFGVSPVNYPDPDPEIFKHKLILIAYLSFFVKKVTPYEYTRTVRQIIHVRSDIMSLHHTVLTVRVWFGYS